jgi:hypothetical protein
MTKTDDGSEMVQESDFLWGAVAIGRETNLKPRQVFHMLEHGLLPAKKVGGKWCSSRAALRRALIGEVA